MVDKVLVCSWQIIVNYPMEVAFLGCELDIDPVRIRVHDRGGCPVEVRSSAVCKSVLVPLEKLWVTRRTVAHVMPYSILHPIRTLVHQLVRILSVLRYIPDVVSKDPS
jgi:hypothetical protein